MKTPKGGRPFRAGIAEHPAINPIFKMVHKYGRTTRCAEVTCPHCSVKRWYPLSTLYQQLKRTNYNGQCRKCGAAQTRAGFYRWALKRNPTGRKSIDAKGYVIIRPTFIDDEDLPLFRQAHQHTKVSWVLEHRWVMTQLLKRPLTSHECVDHMDGNKQNNDPRNLRIYVKGKNQPGSSPGHGTYYHELQLALARIRQLES